MAIEGSIEGKKVLSIDIFSLGLMILIFEVSIVNFVSKGESLLILLPSSQQEPIKNSDILLSGSTIHMCFSESCPSLSGECTPSLFTLDKEIKTLGIYFSLGFIELMPLTRQIPSLLFSFFDSNNVLPHTKLLSISYVYEDCDYLSITIMLLIENFIY
ncbi:hypothetical protein MED121_18500 [Marinomonas sp. MED121]|nr:hypothetical protein MED121_18500 [Marinomonas sp. MED121]